MNVACRAETQMMVERPVIMMQMKMSAAVQYVGTDGLAVEGSGVLPGVGGGGRRAAVWAVA